MARRTFTTFRVFRLLFWLTLLLLLGVGWWFMIRMPGKSFRGSVPPLTREELKLRSELMAHVQMLGGTIGERNLSRYPQLLAAAQYIESQLSTQKIDRDTYEVLGKRCYNIQVEFPGSSPENRARRRALRYRLRLAGSERQRQRRRRPPRPCSLALPQPNEKTLRFDANENEEPGSPSRPGRWAATSTRRAVVSAAIKFAR